MRFLWIFSLFIFFLSSCHSYFSSQTQEFLTQEKSFSDSSVLRFIGKKNLSRVLSKEYYLIKAYLSQEDSELELFSHFTGFDQEDGLRLKFKRQKTGLVIKAAVQNSFYKLLFEDKNYFLRGNELDLTVELDNGARDGFRARIWENFINRNGLVKKKIPALTQENLIADTVEQDMIFYFRGQGLNWGIKLLRSQLIRGARISPKLL